MPTPAPKLEKPGPRLRYPVKLAFVVILLSMIATLFWLTPSLRTASVRLFADLSQPISRAINGDSPEQTKALERASRQAALPVLG
ncbi:MAG: hypothetical protein SGJ20_01750, partial [Planctomycetota bacterium]|nr:hypothetical protein [Planctomycetota bacterium]